MKKMILPTLFFMFLFIRLTAGAASFPLQAKYTIDNSWPSGYQATVTLTNTSSTPTSSWTATFTLPSGESISSLWNGVYTASGQNITVKNPTWIGGNVIAAGGSTTFGMIVQRSSSGILALNNLQAFANGTTPPPPTPPAAPTLNPIKLNSGSTNSYTVSWNSVVNATSYVLQQDTSSGFSNPKTIVSGNILSSSFSNQPNGTYYYRVYAKNTAGTSPASNVQSIIISTPTQLTSPVLQPINNPNGSNQYTVSWSPVANAQGYTLQESTSSDFSNATTAYQGPNLTFQETGKAPGTYYYRALAFAGSVVSAPSNVEQTTVTQTPPPPVTSYILEGYWESWNSQDSVSTIVNMHSNIIDISFANFTSLGNHTYQIGGVECTPQTLSQLVSQAHSLGKKVKVSIGGATYPLGPQLQTLQDAAGMAQAIATYVQQNSLDGVDFDIEDYPSADLQVQLIQDTRQLLGNNAIISYTPKTPASTTAPYNAVIKAAHPYLTDISMMAYDAYPGYNYQQDVDSLIAMGVPAAKIVVGLMPGYDDIGHYTSVSDITAAAQYVKTKGLGGVMFWDLNRDHENLTGLGVDAATNAAWNVFSSQ